MKKFWNEANKEFILSIVYGFITVSVLAFSLLTINDILRNGQYAKVFLFFVFLTLTLSRGILALYVFSFDKKNKVGIIKNLVFTTIYLSLSILSLVLFKTNSQFYRIVSGLYISTIVANRICLIFEKRKRGKGFMIFNIILASLASLLLFVMVETADEEFGITYLSVLLIIIIVISFFEVLSFAFSKIQLKGLLNIIRKTYVFEIFYGLIILMISFSFFFMVTEDSIQTFGDGLWYSFAIITTIGLGDLTVTTVLSRILSAILGAYGIIVVASVTSVIVNYYNEVKTSEKENKNKEIKEEPEEEKKEDKEEK